MRRLAWVVATWFGCGLSPVAPGTVGTLGALPLWCLVRRGGPLAVLCCAGLVTAIGVWASGVIAKDTREPDPQRVVVDEVAGVLLALGFAGTEPLPVLCAIIGFRWFDIRKPWPVARAEALPAGWGIMMDDVVAGLLAGMVALAVRALQIR